MKLTGEQIPEHLRHPKLHTVFTGGCIERGEGSRFRAKAHAHCRKGDPYQGTICFLSHKRLMQRKLGLHELAHIIGECGHTDKFRAICKELGVSIQAGQGLKSYEKRTRTV